VRELILILFFILTTVSFANTKDDYTLNLGNLTFVTSTKSQIAEKHFILGLKFLHNFMYPLALREFKLAEKEDPTFALSYWGQAMCYKWSLWSYENKKKGHAVLQKFHSLKNVKMSPLESGFLNAVEKIYLPGDDLENEKKYIRAMYQLYEKYPNNPDVASFYALGMIGYAMDATQDKSAMNYLVSARSILKKFLPKFPEHPGIVHYYIHVNDLPNSPHLMEGLAAVKNVYQYLNGSSHVLHMPSHLYSAMGDWSKAAYANKLSIHASHAMCKFLEREKISLPSVDSTNLSDENAPKKTAAKWTQKDWYACDADNVYHSLEWLQYDYLQMKNFADAEKLLLEMEKVSKIENENKYDFWAYRMRARQILYTGKFAPLTSLPKPLIETSEDKNWAAYSECGLLLAYGRGAVIYHQDKFMLDINERFKKIILQLNSPSATLFKQSCMLMHEEFHAYKYGYTHLDYCKEELNKALKIQYELQATHQSLTLPFVPAQEVYGEIMQSLASEHTQILKLYENELKFNRNRFQAIEGMAKISKQD